jgi:hypothetical protein
MYSDLSQLASKAAWSNSYETQNIPVQNQVKVRSHYPPPFILLWNLENVLFKQIKEFYNQWISQFFTFCRGIDMFSRSQNSCKTRPLAPPSAIAAMRPVNSLLHAQLHWLKPNQGHIWESNYSCLGPDWGGVKFLITVSFVAEYAKFLLKIDSMWTTQYYLFTMIVIEKTK